METTRLSTKGQIILPKHVREARGWRPGTEFSVEAAGDGILLRPTGRFAESTLDDVVGCLRFKGKAKTLAQMDAGIRREVMRRDGRSRH